MPERMPERGYGAVHTYARPAPPMAYEPSPLPEFEPEPELAPRPMPRPEPVKVVPPAPKPQPQAQAAPAVPAPKPVWPPPAPIEDVPSDDELDDMLGPDRADAASKMFGESARNDTTDINEDTIAKIPDPEPVRAVYAGKDDDDDDFDDDIEPDEIPDPDPIPTVYGGSDEDEDDEDLDEKGGGIKRLIAPAVTIVAIGAIVAGLFLARDYVVRFWPPANDYVYDLVGLHVMVPGEGLKRELTRTAMETVADVDHVIATGLITNISDKEQPLPQVVVQLIDANEKVLNSKTMTLEKATLQPGEVLQFKAVFEGAPATARKVRTDWGPFVPAGTPPPVETH
jgi:hypothetical protein